MLPLREKVKLLYLIRKENLLKCFRIYMIIILLQESVIWYKVYLWMYMNSIYTIWIMLCYV